jgi:hypothetical protein
MCISQLQTYPPLNLLAMVADRPNGEYVLWRRKKVDEKEIWGGGGVSLKIGVVGYLETVSPAKVDHLGNK